MWVCLGCDLLLGLVGGSFLLIQLPNLETRKSLEESRSVVASGSVGELEHLLGELSVELGGGVAEVGLDVDELLEVVEGTVHFDYGDVVSVEGVGAVLEVDAGEGAGELRASEARG